jgi:hypothetical protein
MSDIEYKIMLFNADEIGDDGTDYGSVSSGASIRITIAPGNYNIRITASLSGAFYAEGEPANPVQVTAGSTSSAAIKLTVFISYYLNDPAFSSVPEIDLPLAVTLSSSMWNEILTGIGGQSKFVNLDLSGCKLSDDTSGGGLYANGTFDPDRSNNAGGKVKIKSLILPNAAASIPSGSHSGSPFPAFDGFTNLTTLYTGSGIKTIGEYAFTGLNLTDVTLGSVSEIGVCAFQSNNLTSVTIPAGAFSNSVPHQTLRVEIGTGGIFYTPSTGIEGGFDAFADPANDNFIKAGIYTWDGSNWNYTAP